MCHNHFIAVAGIDLGINKETYAEENPKKYELVDEETAKKRQRMQQFRFHIFIFLFLNLQILFHLHNFKIDTLFSHFQV